MPAVSYCCGRPDCPWEAPEVKQAEDLVRSWIEDYGHEDLLLADKWPLIGRIVQALQEAKHGTGKQREEDRT